MTWVEVGVLRPRWSEHVAFTVTVPGEAPVVSSVALLPFPVMFPLVAVQPLTVTGTLSGLVQVHETFTVPPACKLVGLAVQETVGGFFGGSLTLKLAVAVASPFFFLFGSVM